MNTFSTRYCLPGSIWNGSPLSDTPISASVNTQRRLFCCGMWCKLLKYKHSFKNVSILLEKDNQLPLAEPQHTLTLGKKKYGPIRLVSKSGYSVIMQWMRLDCCSNCFVAKSVKMPTKNSTEFYYIYKSNILYVVLWVFWRIPIVLVSFLPQCIWVSYVWRCVANSVSYYANCMIWCKTWR